MKRGHKNWILEKPIDAALWIYSSTGATYSTLTNDFIASKKKSKKTTNFWLSLHSSGLMHCVSAVWKKTKQILLNTIFNGFNTYEAMQFDSHKNLIVSNEYFRPKYKTKTNFKTKSIIKQKKTNTNTHTHNKMAQTMTKEWKKETRAYRK